MIDPDSDLGDGVIDHNEKKEMKEHMANYKKAVIKQKAFDEELKIGSKFLEVLGKPLPKAPLKAAPAKPIKIGSEIDWKTLASAHDDKAFKRLLPNVPGALLQPVPKKSSYTVYYPGAIPGSCTRVYGKSFGEIAVIKHVVRWIWDEHCKITKEKCPFVI